MLTGHQQLRKQVLAALRHPQADQQQPALKQAFKDHSEVTTLDLSNASLNNSQQLQLLAQILSANTTITELNISGNGIGDKIFNLFAKALKDPTLQNINVNKNSLTDGTPLHTLLKNCPNVTQLDYETGNSVKKNTHRVKKLLQERTKAASASHPSSEASASLMPQTALAPLDAKQHFSSVQSYIVPGVGTFFWDLSKVAGRGSSGLLYEGEFQPPGSGDQKKVPIVVKQVTSCPYQTTNREQRNYQLIQRQDPKIVHHLMQPIAMWEEHGGCQYFALPQYTMDLGDYIHQTHNILLPNKINISWQIAQALYSLHYIVQLIHRDLKSANILVEARPEGVFVVIIDYDLSRREDSILETSPSQVTKFTGTIAYMAPEITNEENASHASDVWSLGVVLWELLHQQKPYADYHNQIALGTAIHNGTAKLEIDESKTGPECGHLIATCLNKHPDRRPNAAMALAYISLLQLPVAERVAGLQLLMQAQAASAPTTTASSTVAPAPDAKQLATLPEPETVLTTCAQHHQPGDFPDAKTTSNADQARYWLGFMAHATQLDAKQTQQQQRLFKGYHGVLFNPPHASSLTLIPEDDAAAAPLSVSSSEASQPPVPQNTAGGGST